MDPLCGVELEAFAQHGLRIGCEPARREEVPLGWCEAEL